MPALLNPKHELCCQALASGQNKKDSYMAGGFSYNPSSADKFFRRPEIVARIQEIVAEKVSAQAEAREIGIKKAGLTEQWITERLMWLIERSLRGKPVLDKNGVQTGQFSGNPDGQTAARCLHLAAQIKGMLIQRHEVGDPGDFARLTDAELDTKLNRMASELGYTKDDLRRAGVTSH